MRLSSLGLLQPLLEALLALGIVSDVDLLLSSGSTLDIWRRLPAGLLSLQEFNAYAKFVLERASAAGVLGDTKLTREAPLISVGVPVLDALLQGLNNPHVLEISGDTQSGKSTLALQALCHHLHETREGSAVWIDTAGDFSPARVKNILNSWNAEAGPILERIQVALAFDVDSAYDVLDSINPGVKNPISFIVIDAITPLLGPGLSAVSAEGHAIMTTFIRQLRSMAEAHNLCVLIINTTTLMPEGMSNPLSNYLTTKRKPALGPTLSALVDATLWLAKAEQISSDGKDVHVAEVFKSRNSETRKQCYFCIESGAIFQS